MPYVKEDQMVEILLELGDDCVVKSPSLTEAFMNVQNDNFNEEDLN